MRLKIPPTGSGSPPSSARAVRASRCSPGLISLRCLSKAFACWSNGIIFPFSLAAKYRQYQSQGRKVSFAVLCVNLIDGVSVKLACLLVVDVRADAVDSRGESGETVASPVSCATSGEGWERDDRSLPV